MNARIKIWLLSGDICQRDCVKADGGRAPWQPTPIIENPFSKVYIDIVGEIHPCSSDGNEWISTTISDATRFPIATPIKTIGSITIMGTLMI
jgi:hypothetical protein